MIYRTLGRTGLSVGVIGLGGEWFNGKSQDVVSDVINSALNNGVNYLDVFMPQETTRRAIGVALAGRRSEMLIQGHLCTVMHEDQYERTRDIEKVKASFEALLTELKTDYIDVGMIHYIDTFEDYDTVFNGEIIQYALELKKRKIIRHLGISSHNPLVALKAVESGLIDVLMFSINAAYDLESSEADIFEVMEYKNLQSEEWTIDPARAQLYKSCEQLGVGITVMKALGAGTLLKADSSPFGCAMSVNQCCHYCLTRPAVTSVLIGCASVEELHEALKYCTATAEELDYTGVFTHANKVKMTGRCMYCNHCQPCPAGIDIAAVTKFLDLARDQVEIPETVIQHYRALTKSAQDCIMCGKCEANCPFEVKIRDNMKKARELFS